MGNVYTVLAVNVDPIVPVTLSPREKVLDTCLRYTLVITFWSFLTILAISPLAVVVLILSPTKNWPFGLVTSIAMLSNSDFINHSNCAKLVRSRGSKSLSTILLKTNLIELSVPFAL